MLSAPFGVESYAQLCGAAEAMCKDIREAFLLPLAMIVQETASQKASVDCPGWTMAHAELEAVYQIAPCIGVRNNELVCQGHSIELFYSSPSEHSARTQKYWDVLTC